MLHVARLDFLLNSNQVHRVYLDELGDIRSLPVWVVVMVLTTIEDAQAPEEARYLLTRTRAEVPQPASRAIIEIITTIMMYRFEQLSRVEVELMLDIRLKETRIYREIKEEATVNLVIRQLTKRLRTLPEDTRASVSSLPLLVLEDLSEALLDFTSLDDLQAWLETRLN